MILKHQDPKTQETLHVAYSDMGEYLGEFTDREQAKAAIAESKTDIGFNPEDYL